MSKNGIFFQISDILDHNFASTHYVLYHTTLLPLIMHTVLLLPFIVLSWSFKIILSLLLTFSASVFYFSL